MQRLPQFFLVFITLLLVSCGGSGSPLAELKKELNQYPEYSVVLEDMKEEGNFFKDYYHKYKVVYGEPVSGQDSLVYQTYFTDWYKVPRRVYQDYWNYLGMVVLAKGADGKITDTPFPPGYQYVGNPRYGRWREDNSGNRFWEFYGKFAFMNAMFNMFRGPVYYNDWDEWGRYRRSNRPYFGSKGQFGTNGSYTQKTYKNFFERRKQKEALRKASFQNKVKNRVRRSNMSSFRSRSGGFGK